MKLQPSMAAACGWTCITKEKAQRASGEANFSPPAEPGTPDATLRAHLANHPQGTSGMGLARASPHPFPRRSDLRHSAPRCRKNVAKASAAKDGSSPLMWRGPDPGGIVGSTQRESVSYSSSGSLRVGANNGKGTRGFTAVRWRDESLVVGTQAGALGQRNPRGSVGLRIVALWPVPAAASTCICCSAIGRTSTVYPGSPL